MSLFCAGNETVHWLFETVFFLRIRKIHKKKRSKSATKIRKKKRKKEQIASRFVKFIKKKRKKSLKKSKFWALQN